VDAGGDTGIYLKGSTERAGSRTQLHRRCKGTQCPTYIRVQTQSSKDPFSRRPKQIMISAARLLFWKTSPVACVQGTQGQSFGMLTQYSKLPRTIMRRMQAACKVVGRRTYTRPSYPHAHRRLHAEKVQGAKQVLEERSLQRTCPSFDDSGVLVATDCTALARFNGRSQKTKHTNVRKRKGLVS
jgi:hypothetical protein